MLPDDFQWPVAVGGYSWELRKARRRANEDFHEKEVLVAQPPHTEPRQYNPLAEPKLYQSLANCSLKNEGIAEFTSRYGLLGLTLTELEEMGPRYSKLYSEQAGDWMVEIVDMRAAIAVWDAMNGIGDLSELVKRFDELDEPTARRVTEWNKARTPFGPGDWALVAQCDTDFDVDYRIAPAPRADSREAAAWEVVKLLANDRLSKHCSPVLYNRSARSLALTPAVKTTPKNLLGAIWQQFTRVILGDVEYRTCLACPRQIEISTEGRGKQSNVMFCSDACRTRDHRNKVKEAKSMKADGKTVSQIAKHFETTSDTINNWLTKKK